MNTICLAKLLPYRLTPIEMTTLDVTGECPTRGMTCVVYENEKYQFRLL